MRIPIDYAAIVPDNDIRSPGPKAQSEMTVNLDTGKKQGPQVGMTLEYDTELQMLIAIKEGGVREVVLIPRERVRHMEPSSIAWGLLKPHADLYPKAIKQAIEQRPNLKPVA
jgi:hypothetical protein